MSLGNIHAKAATQSKKRGAQRTELAQHGFYMGFRIKLIFIEAMLQIEARLKLSPGQNWLEQNKGPAL